MKKKNVFCFLVHFLKSFFFLAYFAKYTRDVLIDACRSSCNNEVMKYVRSNWKLKQLENFFIDFSNV